MARRLAIGKGAAVMQAPLLRVIAIGLAVAIPAEALAQAAWEYTPYEARVWIAQQAAPQLPAATIDKLQGALPARARTTWDGVLQLQVSAAPAGLVGSLIHDFDQLAVEQIANVATAKELDVDKIYLAVIRCEQSGFRIRVRELDCHSRQLGSIVELSAITLPDLAPGLCDAITECFTPLARIEIVGDRNLSARLRAGGLIASSDSPAMVEPGMVLRPIIRRNDRNGQPAKGGIQAIPWSYLTVEERHDSVLECSLRSGYRAAIPARGGVRMERLALVVRPRMDETRLALRSRNDKSKPLAGYEIFRRVGDDNQKMEFLGQTDAKGELTISRVDELGGLETLVVKNGQQLLARLPVVPGYERTLTAYLIDDDGRLAAEGFVEALNSRVIDLVVRREIMAAQIRARIKDGKLDEAQKLLDDFRRLNTRADLTKDLDQFRQQVATGDKTTQERIDRVFADAQKLLLLKPLSDDLLAQLTREVAAARPGSQ
jgi:hypothetical protein